MISNGIHEPKAGIGPTFLLYESSVLPLNYFGIILIKNGETLPQNHLQENQRQEQLYYYQ